MEKSEPIIKLIGSDGIIQLSSWNCQPILLIQHFARETRHWLPWRSLKRSSHAIQEFTSGGIIGPWQFQDVTPQNVFHRTDR